MLAPDMRRRGWQKKKEKKRRPRAARHANYAALVAEEKKKGNISQHHGQAEVRTFPVKKDYRTTEKKEEKKK